MSNKENCIYVLVWLIILVLQTKGDDCPWNSFYLSLLTYNLKYLFTFCPSVRQSIWRVNSEHFRLFLLIIIGSIKSNKLFKICYSDERCGPYASCFNMSIRTRRMMAATDRQRQDVLSLLLSLGRNSRRQIVNTTSPGIYRTYSPHSVCLFGQTYWVWIYCSFVIKIALHMHEYRRGF